MQVQKYVSTVQSVNASQRIMYLTINSVREEDIMGYRCRANNSEGVSEASVVLYGKNRTAPAGQVAEGQLSTSQPTNNSNNNNNKRKKKSGKNKHGGKLSPIMQGVRRRP
ncbi:uncharacterized protein LOC121868171 [Homarus americanus]|uniref:uncharacterized protein LOC121868171 n=1 Tax=Homarus americanus TaxID=6706 RepID=UPI001C4706E3|nr:uncharacterized protein LOC121868171 [Homarus americanus]